jgi:hypothetical protein
MYCDNPINEEYYMFDDFQDGIVDMSKAYMWITLT